MRRHLGRTTLLAGILGLAALLFWLRSERAGEQICASARTRLPELLGGRVNLGRCSVDPLRGAVEIVGFGFIPAGAEEPLVAAERVVARLRLIDLLSGRLHVERVEVERPRVALDLADLGGGSRGQGCFLDEAAKLEVDNLSVTGARVRLTGQAGRSADLEDVDLDLRLTSRSYTARLAVARGRLETGGLGLALSRLRLSVGLDLDEQRLTVNQLELAAGDFAASAQGEVETVCDPRASLELSLAAPLDLITAVLGQGAPQMSGHAALALRVEGGLEDPNLEGELSLSRMRIEGFEVGDAFLEARYSGGQVEIDRLSVAVGEGVALAKGTLQASGDFPLSASVDLDGVELARVLDKVGLHHAWPNFAGTGRVEVKGQLFPFHLAGPASIEVRDFRVHDRGFDRPNPGTLLQFDRAKIELQADFNPERARLSRARIRTDRSEVEAEAALNFDLRKGLDIQATVVDLDLGELGHIVGIPWGGRIAGKATIRGPYTDPRISGSVTGREFRFHKLALGRVEGLVEFHRGVLAFPSVNAQKGVSRLWASGELDLGAEGGPYARGRATVDDARLADLIDVIGDEFWLFDLLRGRVGGTVTGEARVDDRILAPRADINLTLKDTTYFERKLGQGVLDFRARDGEIVAIDRLEFDGPCGQVSMRGEVRLSEGMDFAIEGPSLHLDQLFEPDASFIGAKGELIAKARLFGPFDHARMEGTVDARGVQAFGVDLGSGLLTLAMDRTRLSLKGPLGQDLLIDARMVTEGALPYAVGVSFSTVDLGHYVPQVEGLRGSATADLFATGSVERYQETRGDLLVRALTLSKGDYQAWADAPAALAFEGAAVELRALSLRGGGGTRLTATGMRSSEGLLDLAVEGGFDARLLEPVTPWLEQLGGRVEFDASIAGPTDKPTVVGSALVSDGRFGVKGWPVTARGLKGRLEFSQNKVFVTGVEGSVNGGRAELQGGVELKDLSPARFDLELGIEEVPVRWPEDVPSAFSGQLRLTGAPEDLLLSGELDLLRLRYSRDLDLETVLNDLQHRRMEARSFEKKDDFLRFDLAVRVLPDARIDNNLLKLTLGGKVNVVGTNAHMGLLGTLQSVEAGRAYFRGNEYAVTRVTVELTGRDHIQMVLDANAETVVRDYRVWAHAWGPLDELEVDLRSEPELDRGDVVTLLTLGVTSLDAGMYSAGAGAGLVGETLFNIAGLDKQMKKFIPENKILRDFSFQISTQYSEISGMVEPTAQFESRFMTDSLRLRLTQPVISGRGRRAQAEYRFNEHVSAQAQWDNESSDSSIGDFGLDLKLRWERE